MSDSEKLQLEGFNDWFNSQLLACGSCLTRDVLRNQKKALLDEWMRICPMLDLNTYIRDSSGRIVTEESK